MTKRRQFLGAAAAAVGFVPFNTENGRSLESGDDYVDAEKWDHAFTKEFRGILYRPTDLSSFAWANSQFVTIESGISDGAGDLSVEFREEHSDKPGTVTRVAFASRFDEEDVDLELSTFCEVDVAAARELAHIILEETEPVEDDE